MGGGQSLRNKSAIELVPPELLAALIIHDIVGFALNACCLDGLYMEFGVFNGKSLRQIRLHLRADIALYGFDSFEGLPEPWNGFKAGAFATPFRCKLLNTEIIEGWFSDTLPEFVRQHPEPVAFMHIDCDLYSSTKTVLDAFARQIVPGTIILFDELFGFAGYEVHEYRALKEFGRPFECIARWNAYRAAIRIV